MTDFGGIGDFSSLELEPQILCPVRTFNIYAVRHWFLLLNFSPAALLENVEGDDEWLDRRE